jgi:hypothetical protein
MKSSNNPNDFRFLILDFGLWHRNSGLGFLHFGFLILDFGLKEKSLMRSKQYVIFDFGLVHGNFELGFFHFGF